MFAITCRWIAVCFKPIRAFTRTETRFDGKCHSEIAFREMTLRIEKSQEQRLTIFTLSGSLDAEHVPELERLFGSPADYTKIMMDLQDLRFADRDAVRFFSKCEMAGLKLRNCPAYVREWMNRERDEYK